MEVKVSASRIVLSGISARIQGLQWQSSSQLRIGRGASVEVVLDDPSVSSLHAEVRATARGWVVCDMGSAGGTLLNGVRLAKVARSVQEQDILQCGKMILRVNHLTLAAPPAVTAARAPATIKTSGETVRVQFASQHSWEQGVQALAHDHGVRQGKQFLTLLRAGHHLCRIDSLPELLQSILEDTVAVLDAQRGGIALLDETTGQFVLRAVAGGDGPGEDRCFSSTLAQKCFARGESLLCARTAAELSATLPQDPDTGPMASIICALLRSPRKRLGVLHLDRSAAQPPFTESDFRLADGIAASISVGIESAQLKEREQHQSTQQVVNLVRQLEQLRLPDGDTHSEHIGRYAAMLAAEIGLPHQLQQLATLGALVHDLGELAVDDAVLRNRGRLSVGEAAALQRHVQKGVALAETVPALAPLIPMIRHHHERWDGKGYPAGLAAEQIPTLARVIAVVDAFDDLTTGRAGQRPRTVTEALSELRAAAGTEFDPRCIDAMLSLAPKLEVIVSSEATLTA
jgi:HD-GYP domain-containing protein (c-di-GMP phosphodiesterase class II)